MNLTELVCSREWGEKLKEAGVPQESEFYWWQGVVFYKKDLSLNALGSRYAYSAYLTGELGEMLPTRISNKIDGTEEEKALSPYHFVEFPVKRPIDWFSTIHSVKGRNIYSFYGNTEANARAQILHYLIKEGLVKPEDLK